MKRSKRYDKKLTVNFMLISVMDVEAKDEAH